MGLFDRKKKECDLCGKEIKLLGNRKLEDGNCCKDCAAKLSPFFHERKSSTVAEIREQLEYREANKNDVAAFHTTRALGNRTKVYLDEDARKFMVTSATNLADANPDVMNFSDVTGCTIDVNDSRSEQTREGKDGKQVSFNPPRYDYSYNIYVEIQVNNPYFNKIRFQLNDDSIEINDVRGNREPDPEQNYEFRETRALAEEIKTALLTVRKQARKETIAANTPVGPVKCPCCGATTTPENGCCEYCGSPVK